MMLHRHPIHQATIHLAQMRPINKREENDLKNCKNTTIISHISQSTIVTSGLMLVFKSISLDQGSPTFHAKWAARVLQHRTCRPHTKLNFQIMN